LKSKFSVSGRPLQIGADVGHPRQEGDHPSQGPQVGSRTKLSEMKQQIEALWNEITNQNCRKRSNKIKTANAVEATN
jgi:hypothetical protein